MPRTERPLDAGDGPALGLAAGLRQLREKAGSPTYRELAQRTHYSVATLAGAADGRKLPSLAVTLAYVRACDGDVHDWEQRWNAAAAELAAETSQVPDRNDARSPYVGLTAFQPEDAQRFFGRERLVEELVGRLARQRFVALFGASGAGKSSLLRAGLMPRLSDAVLFTPGPHPVEECAINVSRVIGATPGQLTAEFSADPRNVHLRLRQADRELVLVVDQFEEVFTLCQEVDERAQFLTALLTAAHADNSNCRVVLGVRADFYAHCTSYPELVAALDGSQVAVGPMTIDELRRAITQPAVDAGCIVEGALLATLMAQAAGQAGVLPLLSHALLETWRRRRGNTLTLTGFQAAGGIDGALVQTAESLYTGLDRRQRVLARSLLLRLTALGEGTEDTKRRIGRGELDRDDPDTDTVLDSFAAARLVTLGANTVELAHESLIGAWPRLQEWLAQDREGQRIHRRLTEAAASWEELGQDSSALYRGTRLVAAREWVSRTGAALTARERKFLYVSAATEESEHATARRHTRRIRQLIALLTVGFVLATVATVAAIRAQQVIAEHRNIALSQRVLTELTSLRAARPGLAAQLSLIAYRLAPTVEARSSLLSAVSSPYSALLTDHSSVLNSVVYSPDGRLLASASGDRTARLWDMNNSQRGRGLATLTGHTDVVWAVAFSRDGKALATASDDHTVRLWDITDPRHPSVKATLGHPDSVRSVAFSPDGHTLATTSNDHIARLWEISDPRQVKLTAVLVGHTNMVPAVAFSPDGHLLATGSDDHTVRLWEISSPSEPKHLATLTEHTAIVVTVAFSPDGHTLATGGQDRTARLWDITNTANPTILVTITGHTDHVRSVAFSPDGHTLATASNDHTVRLWDTANPRQLRALTTLTEHTDHVTSVAFSPDGRMLATGSDDHTARLWDLPGTVLPHHLDYVFGVAFSPDGNTLATASQDHTIRLWDVTNPHLPAFLATLTGHTDNVYGVAFSPDGHTLASTSEDLTVRLWNVTNLHQPSALAVITGHTKNPEGVAFSPDGRTLATTGQDLTVRLWDVTNLRQPGALAVLTGHTDVVRWVAFSPDGHTLVSTSGDHTVRLWDVTSLRQSSVLAVLTSHTDTVRSAAFSPDGRTLATGSDDQTARLWDVTNLRQPGLMAMLTGHSHHVESVAFSPDGRTLATASQDHTARLWNVTNPHQPSVLAILTGHTDRIHRVTFSPDGHTLATTSRDKTARLWETNVDRAAAHICDAIHPVISHAEWIQHFPDLPYQTPCP